MAGLKSTAADAALGARLIEARRAAGLTQRTVGEVLGVSAAQLQKYENGKNKIAATTLAAFAALTGRPVAWFFGPIAASPEQAAVRDLTATEAREALCAAAETFFQAKHREGSLKGANVVAFIGEAA